MFNLNVMASKALALPANTPPEIVEAYNKAMAEVVADLQKPENKKKADEVIGPYPQSLGDAAGSVLRGAVQFNEQTFAWLQKWVADKTNAQ